MVWEVARFRFPVEGATGSNMFQLPLTMAAAVMETRAVVKTSTIMEDTTSWRERRERLANEYCMCGIGRLRKTWFGNSKARRRPELIRLSLFHMQNAALLHANIHLDCPATSLQL